MLIVWLAGCGGECEQAWFADLDGDGLGDARAEVSACEAPEGHVANNGDCDDADPSRGEPGVWEGDFPDLSEIYDGGDPADFDWGALCDACVDRVEGNVIAPVDGEPYMGVPPVDDEVFWCLREVAGNLSIATSASDLAAFERVTLVTGALEVSGANIESLDALEGLTGPGSLMLDAPGVTDLSPLRAVLHGRLEGRVVLRLGGGSLQGAEGLLAVGDYLEVGGNYDSLDGLGALEQVGGLVFSEFTVPTFDGLTSLTEARSLRIEASSLDGFPGFPALDVDELSVEGPVSSLEGLEGVTARSVNLHRTGLGNLTGLAGLDALESLDLEYNDQLTGLEGLEGLTSAAFLRITGNASLTDLTGLEGLDAVEALSIWSNPEFESTEGLGALTSVDLVDLFDNPSLVALTDLTLGTRNLIDGAAIGDFSGVRPGTVAELELRSAGVSSLVGLESVTHLDKLDLYDLDLINLEGLGGLTSAGSIEVALLSSLDSLSGAEALQTVDTLRLRQAPDLTTLAGLSALTSVGEMELASLGAIDAGPPALATVGDLLVFQNAFDVMPAFPALTTATGNVSIQNNQGMADLSGLAALETVDGFMSVEFNSGLQTMNGLEALRSVGSVMLQANGGLHDVTALHSVESIVGNLGINQNQSLPDAEAQALVDAIGIGNIGSVSIGPNGG